MFSSKCKLHLRVCFHLGDSQICLDAQYLVPVGEYWWLIEVSDTALDYVLHVADYNQ